MNEILVSIKALGIMFMLAWVKADELWWILPLGAMLYYVGNKPWKDSWK